MYGFSLVHSARARSARGEVLDCFRDDANWNNPGSVMLMQQAFGINDEYNCNIVEAHSDASYVDLRAEHNKMIARRLCQEGSALRDRGSFIDSCKRFDSAIQFDPNCASAYEGRGDVKVQLGKREEALQDYEAACTLQPENESVRAVANQLRATLHVSAPSRFVPSSAGSTASANTAAFPSSAAYAQSSCALTSTAPAPGRLSLIGKLQQSLSRDEIARALDTSSSSSSSSSDSDSNTGDGDDGSVRSARSSGGGSKKKRKHSSEKRDRKSKKRKSRHKSKRDERKKKSRKH
jgi:tetratricopeptide (TPR) repeat protein